MNEEVLKERERIEKIIADEIEIEIKLKRIKNVSRLNHIKEQLFFKIDNPNYKRKEPNNNSTH